MKQTKKTCCCMYTVLWKTCTPFSRYSNLKLKSSTLLTSTGTMEDLYSISSLFPLETHILDRLIRSSVVFYYSTIKTRGDCGHIIFEHYLLNFFQPNISRIGHIKQVEILNFATYKFTCISTRAL